MQLKSLQKASTDTSPPKVRTTHKNLAKATIPFGVKWCSFMLNGFKSFGTRESIRSLSPAVKKILKNHNLAGLRYRNHFRPWRTTNTFGEIAFRNVEVYRALRNDRWLEKQSLTFLRSH